MPSIKSLILAGSLALASVVRSQPFKEARETPILPPQVNGTECGSHQYNESDIREALAAGVFCITQQEDSRGFPKPFSNPDHFDFGVSAPLYQYPILPSHKIMDPSQDPGTDRVIFNTKGQLAAVVAAEGAKYALCDAC